MESLRSQLLVATPQLPDENFYRTVVLMVEHNKHGALGVVLNRQADQSIEQLWSQVSDTPCHSPQKVNLGGPVSGPVLAVHTNRELAEIEILSGVYLAAQKHMLDQLVQQETHPYRIYVGHAGWGGGQLEGELQQGAWLVTPATEAYVFYEQEDLWETVAKHIGDSILLDSLHLKNLPDDPTMN